jgi:N-acetylneuraminate lyase
LPARLYEARFRIPNLRGLKFSHDDLVELQGCVAMGDGAFDILFGFDESLLAGLCLGACWGVGSTYNFADPHYLRLLRAFQDGDLAAARNAQFQATEMVKTLASLRFHAASKAVMAMIGVDCGPVRSSLRYLSSTQLAALADKLSSFDVFARPLRRSEMSRRGNDMRSALTGIKGALRGLKSGTIVDHTG